MGSFGKDKAETSKRFIDNGDGTVTDKKMGLMWQQKDDNEKRFWDEAIEYIKSLNLAGYRDWRLPTCDELMSIVDQEGKEVLTDWDDFASAINDYSKRLRAGEVTHEEPSPDINEDLFPGTKPHMYWTSSPNMELIPFNEMQIVNFDGGHIYHAHKISQLYVRCVRSLNRS